jgi:hypothetical protein
MNPANPFPFLGGAPAAPAAPAGYPPPQAPQGYPGAPSAGYGYPPPPAPPGAPQGFYSQPAPQPQGDFFSGTNNMDPSNRLPFLPADFQGRIKIDATKGISGQKGRAYIAEFTVLTSNRADIIVGGKYSWYQGINERQTATAWGSCIAFLYAALGLDGVRHRAGIDAKIKPNQDAILNSTSKEGNTVLVGREVMLQTSNKVTKEKKANFTLHTFSPTPEGMAAADQMFATPV